MTNDRGSRGYPTAMYAFYLMNINAGCRKANGAEANGAEWKSIFPFLPRHFSHTEQHSLGLAFLLAEVTLLAGSRGEMKNA